LPIEYFVAFANKLSGINEMQFRIKSAIQMGEWFLRTFPNPDLDQYLQQTGGVIGVAFLEP